MCCCVSAPSDERASRVTQLEYRSLRFEEEYHEPEGGYYQEALQARGERARALFCSPSLTCPLPACPPPHPLPR